jgi:hypothetical protein
LATTASVSIKDVAPTPHYPFPLSEGPPSTSAVPLGAVCRFWDDGEGAWSSRGVLTVGFVQSAAGQWYLSCASTHLTGFTGTLGALGVEVSFNVVHPIDDAGHMTVRRGSSTSSSC